MKNNKNNFKWTEHLINCEKTYDGILGQILQGKDVQKNLDLLAYVAENENENELAGYAAYVLSELYDGENQKYVPANPELRAKYLELASKLGETDAIIEKIENENEEEPWETIDKLWEELLNDNCLRPYSIWLNRASIRRFKCLKGWEHKNLIKNFLFRRIYLFKAYSSIPKQRYFDSTRKTYRKYFVKATLPIVAIIALIIFIAIIA